MPCKLVSGLTWWVARVKVLTGVAALGAATGIFTLFGERRMDNRNSQVSLKLIFFLILAGISLLFFIEPD